MALTNVICEMRGEQVPYKLLTSTAATDVGSGNPDEDADTQDNFDTTDRTSNPEQHFDLSANSIAPKNDAEPPEPLNIKDESVTL